MQELLRENANPEAEFNVNYLTAFSVVVKDEEGANLNKLAQVNSTEYENVMSEFAQACPSIAQVTPKQMANILKLCIKETSLAELMEASSATSRRTFVRNTLKPILDVKLISLTYPDNPRHPQQKYYLTEVGQAVLKALLS